MCLTVRWAGSPSPRGAGTDRGKQVSIPAGQVHPSSGRSLGLLTQGAYVFLRALVSLVCGLSLLACGVVDEQGSSGSGATSPAATQESSPESTAVVPTGPPSSTASAPTTTASSLEVPDEDRTVVDGVRLDVLESTEGQTQATLTNLNDLPVDVQVRVIVAGTGVTPIASLEGRARLDGRDSATVMLLPTEPGGSSDARCSESCNYTFFAEAVTAEPAGEEPVNTERDCTPSVCRLDG